MMRFPLVVFHFADHLLSHQDLRQDRNKPFIYCMVGWEGEIHIRVAMHRQFSIRRLCIVVALALTLSCVRVLGEVSSIVYGLRGLNNAIWPLLPDTFSACEDRCTIERSDDKQEQQDSE